MELVVLVIPALQDVQGSAPITSRVDKAFSDRGATVVDLTSILAGRRPGELVVNAYDAHANAGLHRQMADILLKVVTERMRRTVQARQ